MSCSDLSGKLVGTGGGFTGAFRGAGAVRPVELADFRVCIRRETDAAQAAAGLRGKSLPNEHVSQPHVEAALHIVGLTAGMPDQVQGCREFGTIGAVQGCIPPEDAGLADAESAAIRAVSHRQAQRFIRAIPAAFAAVAEAGAQGDAVAGFR